ncbi:MAG: VOC family protein [Pseudomonadota bacterium]
MALPRIRQLVFASREQTDIARLQTILGLGKGFVDPGVSEFGLTNGVFALGDQFLEVVVPTQEQTAAGRFLTRTGGVGGYMAIFQTEDLERVRQTADALSIRRVWNIDLPEISASHLHPADIGAAIVSIDEARPESAWRWGGPDWQHTATPGRLQRLDIVAADPKTLSARWGRILNVTPVDLDYDLYELPMGSGCVRFYPGSHDYLSAFQLGVPDPSSCLARAAERGLACETDSFMFCGVKLELTAIDPDE